MNSITLDRTDLVEVINREGDRFMLSTPDIHTAGTIFWRYRFDDIRRTDRVIDCGANIGAFSLAAARRTEKTVLAIEPVRFTYLRWNILNNRANVHPVFGAIGNGSPASIEWNGSKVVVPTAPLRGFIDMVGECDFLKLDVEGAEWTIRPNELNGIRRIEGQLHFDLCTEKWDHPFMRYLLTHYTVIFTPNTPGDGRDVVGPTPDFCDIRRPQFHAWRIE